MDAQAGSDAGAAQTGTGALAAPVRPGRQARRGLHHAVRARGRSGLRAAGRRGGAGAGADRLAGGVPVHPGHPRHRLPRQAVDDPPVLRLRQRAADQRAVQDAAGGRGRGPFRGLRHADPDGPRLRRPALAGRGRALRRGHRLGRRHGRAVRGHPAGRHHHLDDDQRAGRAGLLHVPGGRRAPGRGPVQAGRDPADRHLQGVHRAEGVAVRAAPAPAPHRRPDAVLRPEHPPVQAAVGVRLPHQGGGLDGRPGTGLHAGRRVRLRGARPLPRPGRGRVRARACPSSSTRTSTSSRRSPSSAPPGGSGPGGCATSTAPAPSGRSGCASTPRRRASR